MMTVSVPKITFETSDNVNKNYGHHFNDVIAFKSAVSSFMENWSFNLQKSKYYMAL